MQHVAIDIGGNVTVTAGAYPQQYDPMLPTSAAVIRYGRDGSTLWQRTLRYGEYAWPNLLAVDTAGNAWIVIYDYYRELDDGREHFTVVKLATDGAQQWRHRFTDGALGTDTAHAALMSADGALILAADINAGSSSDRLGLIRLSDQPRADHIFVNGFDGAPMPAPAD